MNMNSKLKYLIACSALLPALVACNDYDVIEQEQYKHVFSFVSNSDHINEKVFSLNDTEATGYISLSMGGSTAIDRDVHIKIVEDPKILSDYNMQTYDVNVDKYARALPKRNYTIESLDCVIKAGENKGVIPVKINPAGLSPDSIYFLAFRIDSFDAYEADPENNYLLYRVRTYNAWARSDGSSSYTMMGQRTEDGEDAWLRMPGSKVFYPISGNVVRTMAANEEFGSSSINLDRYAMLIEIGGDGSLKLSPYRDLEIKQVMPGDADFDAEYPNTYTLEKTSYSTYHNFLLHYRYKNSEGKWWAVKEELRMQVVTDNQ